MASFINEAYRNAWNGTKTEPVLVEGKLVYPQRNKWSCGPWALRHCLMKWDLDVDPYTIMELANTTRSAGTSEKNLEVAAKKLGCRYEQHTKNTAKDAKRTILRLLGRGQPLILCIEKWEHWIACLHHSSRGFLIFNSDRHGHVIQLRSWRWLKKKMSYVDKKGTMLYNIASVARPVQRSRRG